MTELRPAAESAILLIAYNGPGGHEQAYGEEAQHLMGHIAETTATDKDGADGVDEIVHGVDVGGQVGPVWHGARGGEESAEQHDADDEEPYNEDGLLHGVAVVGDDEAERGEEQGQEHGEHVDQPEGSGWCEAIDEPCQQEADGDDEEGYEPIGNELGEDEGPLRHGCDVDLLDGAGLFLAHDVECGQEARHQHHHDGQQGRNHVEFVVLVLVVEQESRRLYG